ncbi:MAG: hypothetical protein KGP27_09405 [Hyphomicrobiales bacterium]|nr:hypothetical protein [Hyphomicrobiales bacterium]
MASDANKGWFVPKRYGYGATPSGWRGWVATIVFVLVVLAYALAWNATHAPGGPSLASAALFTVGLGLMTALFSVFARSKTDGEWRWRRGDKD